MHINCSGSARTLPTAVCWIQQVLPYISVLNQIDSHSLRWRVAQRAPYYDLEESSDCLKYHEAHYMSAQNTPTSICFPIIHSISILLKGIRFEMTWLPTRPRLTLLSGVATSPLLANMLWRADVRFPQMLAQYSSSSARARIVSILLYGKMK